MRKKFISKKQTNKKKKKHLILKLILFICVIYLTYQVTTYVFIRMKLADTNEEFLLSMMEDSNHHLLYEKNNKNIIVKATRFLTGLDLDNPSYSLKQAFNYDSDKVKDTTNDTLVTNKVNYISDPKKTESKSPRVYIYNTHQHENYSMKNLEVYNITPNVIMASYLLREKLNNLSINTFVEERKIADVISNNGWSKNETYKASRTFIKEVIEDNKDLDLLIDLHRDSIIKDKSTISINKVNYAKLLFVVGTNNTNYSKNLERSKAISNKINSKYPGLSRGVITKEGEDVNGIYNQDLSEKIVLIECGGYENTIDEVSNSIDALSSVLKEYLGE